jgi:LPS export ABC transporter protein LptC
MVAAARRFFLAAALGLLLPACGGTPLNRQPDASAPPFVFRALDLRQQDLLGRPTWSLNSPEARYDMRRRVALAETPKGVIFRNGKPAYRLSATSGTVLNDGEVVLLEGRVRVEQLGPSPMLIRAERARWFPERKLMEIDRSPEALDASNRLTASRANFNFDDNRLKLRDRPRLQHWNRRFDPFREVDRGRAEVLLRVNEADWFPLTGRLETRGPLEARRRVPGRPDSQPRQILTATSMDGNTRTQEYRLRAPVRFQDAAEATDLQAQDVRLDLRERRATSDSPFQGSHRDLRVSGRSFLVREDQKWVTIPEGCQLFQTGDALQARRCSWNWATQEVQAEGGVELRRPANQQISRGERLSGRLGPAGEITLTSPGSRVFSRFQVPQRPGPPRLSRPRPAAEPIRL